MSRGSYFELLKETKSKEGADAVRACMPKTTDEKDDPFTRKRLKEGRFFTNGSWDFVLDTKDEKATCYDSILHLEFNSMFSSLREHYEESEYMSSSGNDRHVISREEAVEMIRAIDYILLEKFDKSIEEVMSNGFIEIFGDLSREYSLWKYRQMFPEDKDYNGSDIEDMKSSLKNIRTILDAFLIATEFPDESEGRYLLTYVVWG